MENLQFKEISEGICPEKFSVFVAGIFLCYCPDVDSLLLKIRRLIDNGQNPNRIKIRKEIVQYYDFTVAV